jgi:hypothetical protein
MAETAARHVNTMAAHHAPNWSRKQHVDGAHDKPSATSGSHGRRPHNATKPKRVGVSSAETPPPTSAMAAAARIRFGTYITRFNYLSCASASLASALALSYASAI